MLTSVGLLALLPYFLKQGWKKRNDAGLISAPSAAATFDRSSSQPHAGASVPSEDVEELMAHLFSLRMTVSELAAEVQDVHGVLEASDQDTKWGRPEESLNTAKEAA